MSDTPQDRTPEFVFNWDPATKPLGEAIGEAIGYASLLWDKPPQGVFESDRAGDLINELLHFLASRQSDPRTFAPSDLVTDIAHVLNYYSQENGSDTPDFVLAEYLLDALRAFERGVRMREAWYGRPLDDGQEPAPPDDDGPDTAPI